jgi:hypothetical protein
MLLVAGAGAAGLQVLHARRDWGATADQAAAALPGDKLVPEPAEQTTLAVTVDAPAEEIWAWLCRSGRTAAACTATTGWRTSSACTSTAPTRSARSGSTSPSATASLSSRRATARRPPATPSAWRVDPPRALVLRQAPPEHPWNGVWSFHVLPRAEGRCRLLARARTEVQPQVGLRIATRLGEPVTLVMTRRMLHDIKQRAERRTRQGGS